jgi:hypothetical protein
VGSAVITATSSVNNVITAACTVTVQAAYNGAGVSIVFDGPEDETIVLETPVNSGDLITVTAPSGYERYLWYLDGSRAGTTSSGELTLYWPPIGKHSLTVIVEKSDGSHFSKTLPFTVGY